jgi:Glycosyltransferase
MIAWFFRIGEFSRINDAVSRGLRARFPEHDWREVDVERDIVRAEPILFVRANAEALARYGIRIATNRQPPRDFFPRLPVVLDAIRQWVRRNVDPTTTAFVFQTQSLFDARREGCRHFLYTDHTYLANLRYPEPKPLMPVAPTWREMECELYRRADCVFVSSRFAEESVREDYHAERVECVFSGSNVPAARMAERSGRTILFVGVDWERKGGAELLAAFREVRREMPDAKLWIAGCDPGVREEGVTIFGRVSAERVADLYAEADVFCLPSRMDPSASVLAEAAAARLPVVATPVGGNLERVEDGKTGFLREPQGLASALVQLLRDANLRAQMGEAGRRMALDRFTWDAVCDRMAARIRAVK